MLMRLFNAPLPLAGMAVAVIMLSAVMAQAQTKTEETRTVTDSLGNTSTTKVVILSSSRDVTPLNHIIAINPLKFFLFYNLSYYHRLSPIAVGGIGFQIPTLSDIRGFGVNAEIRIHPSARAPRGFYVAPNISYNSLTTDAQRMEWDTQKQTYVYRTVSASASAITVGGLVGWQWFPGDDFAMGLGIGADYYLLSGEDDTKSAFLKYDGFAPTLRFDIGFAW